MISKSEFLKRISTLSEGIKLDLKATSVQKTVFNSVNTIKGPLGF